MMKSKRGFICPSLPLTNIYSTSLPSCVCVGVDLCEIPTTDILRLSPPLRIPRPSMYIPDVVRALDPGRTGDGKRVT